MPLAAVRALGYEVDVSGADVQVSGSLSSPEVSAEPIDEFKGGNEDDRVQTIYYYKRKSQ